MSPLDYKHYELMERPSQLLELEMRVASGMRKTMRRNVVRATENITVTPEAMYRSSQEPGLWIITWLNLTFPTGSADDGIVELYTSKASRTEGVLCRPDRRLVTHYS